MASTSLGLPCLMGVPHIGEGALTMCSLVGAGWLVRLSESDD
jgi:hypothetical protein